LLLPCERRCGAGFAVGVIEVVLLLVVTVMIMVIIVEPELLLGRRGSGSGFRTGAVRI